MTALTRTFRSGNSQAVRLPKEVAFDDNVELVVSRVGDVVTLQPRRPSMAELVARLRTMPTPGEIEVREKFEFPDRPGL